MIERQNRLKQVAVGTLLVLAAAWTLSASGQENGKPVKASNPATQPNFFDACRQFSQPVVWNSMIEKEKKLPTHVTFILEDQSLADGYLALQEYTLDGFVHAHVSLDSLALSMQGECTARMQEIYDLQTEIKELQRQVSALQKQLRPTR